jgi:tetratricopeptide (TPR) repeat protein
MNISESLDIVLDHFQSGKLRQAEYICKKILKKHPNNVDALHFLGVIYSELGNPDLAIDHINRALQVNPNFADAHNNLGNIYQKVGQIDSAIIHYRKAIQLNPNAQTYYNLGIALQDRKRIDEAIDCYEKALGLNFKKPGVYNNLGLALKDKGKVNEAIICYQKALKIDPNFAESFYNLGNAIQAQYRLDEAISYFQKAIQLNPKYFEALNNMGNIFIIQGKLNEGIHCFKKALQLRPNYPTTLQNVVGNPGLNINDSKELLKLTEEMIREDLSEKDKISAYFIMGKLCDNLQMFKESFEYYRLGNALKRTQFEFNIDSHIDYLSRVKKTFSADFVKQRKSWGSNSEMPIFIFGMPRSGSTLVEQILASHPSVYGGGEFEFFTQMEQRLASVFKLNGHYPECLNYLDEQTAHDIAELYIREIRKLTGSSPDYIRITDKNLFNFKYLGLISLLFPKASFIHCQRDPLDTCISIFFQNFSSDIDFAFDMNELGQYYREYLKLMNYWRHVLPINIFEVKYEDIIQQQEEVSRKLIEFCGLEWDSACLNFYEKDRPVFTASNWQVRQPIYTKSCGRWRNYEQFLKPLKELLADFI